MKVPVRLLPPAALFGDRPHEVRHRAPCLLRCLEEVSIAELVPGIFEKRLADLLVSRYGSQGD